MRISDWSSDVCSSDLLCRTRQDARRGGIVSLRSVAHDRADAGRDDGDAASRRSRRASRRRQRFARVAEQVRQRDRKSVVSGKRGSVRVNLGGRRITKKKKTTPKYKNKTSTVTV